MSENPSIDNNAKKENETKNSAEEMYKKYCPTLFNAIKENKSDNIGSYSHLFSELAENALSAEVLGKPGAEINYITTEINETLTTADSIKSLKRAELHYLETRETIKKFQSIKSVEELTDNSEIIKSIKLGISRYNILFVLLLIGGLTWGAINLPKDALALVSAAIGGAITHLLSERQSVLSIKSEKNGNNCECASRDEH
ncbi:hypothetical protein FOT62_22915 [Serratia marcescens]|uniref:Uncharacterized protein n=1 Tax=Serratia marcescens TaxID=615 RepID=A0A5C7BS69_SERMA|nr:MULTISPECIES: hypothetical protein [Serratia]TXE27169.1 hypothetical protein FOT62_22915 [Serratia marcescens]TXE55274.1 hypothetical protein FOT56_25250 [Serratia marcescens]